MLGQAWVQGQGGGQGWQDVGRVVLLLTAAQATWRRWKEKEKLGCLHALVRLASVPCNLRFQFT